MDLAYARSFARAVALANTRGYTWVNINSKFVKAIDRENFLDAAQIVQILKKDSNLPTTRLLTLISDVLAVVNSKTPEEAQVAEKRYVARILEYMQIGYEGIYGSDSGSRFLRWLRPGRGIMELRKQQEIALHLYWWLQIVLARKKNEEHGSEKEKNGFPSWDGIRIVREQVQI